MKIHQILSVLITFAFMFIASGCGSSSDSGTVTPPPTFTNADPTGIWEGTFTEDGVGTFDLIGIVYENKVMLSSIARGVVYIGAASVSGDSITATPTNYANSSFLFESADMLGTVSTKSIISGTFTTSSGKVGSFSLAYNAVTDKEASLAIIDGNWTRAGGYTVVISADSSGAITGSDTYGCVYIGSISVIDTAVNIYDLAFEASSCSVTIYNGTFSGYLFVTDTVTTNDTITYFFDNTDTMVFQGLTRT